MSVAAKGLAHVGVGPFPEVTGIRSTGAVEILTSVQIFTSARMAPAVARMRG
jgi:hypothetical protein